MQLGELQQEHDDTLMREARQQQYLRMVREHTLGKRTHSIVREHILPGKRASNDISESWERYLRINTAEWFLCPTVTKRRHSKVREDILK